jgi:hypothetical protein
MVVPIQSHSGEQPTMPRRISRLAIVVAVLTAGICLAQFRPWPDSGPRGDRSGRFTRIEGGALVDEDTIRTARETPSHSTSTPNWTNPPGFESDVFTFARVIFQSDPPRGPRRGFGRGLGWWVDFPDADLNLSYRLQQLTSIRTDPDARVLKLTNPELFDYPLLYLEHAGYMRLSDEEIAVLRKYFATGGALFVNDFWSAPDARSGPPGELQRVDEGTTGAVPEHRADRSRRRQGRRRHRRGRGVSHEGHF